MRTVVDVDLERRMQEVERNAEYLAERTSFICDQTDLVKRSLWKESKLREESLNSVLGGVADVRNCVEETLARELDTFRSMADEKLSALTDATSKLQDIEMRVQADAEREIRQVLQYATATSEENDTWRDRVQNEIKGDLRDLTVAFNKTVDESISRVDGEISAVKRRMTQTIDETCKREIEEGCERSVEIQSLQYQLSNIRQDQRAFVSRIDELCQRIGSTADNNSKLQQRVEKIGAECMATIGIAEESFLALNKAAVDATHDLSLDLQKKMDRQRGDLDVLNGMVEHGKMQHHSELEKLRKEMSIEISQMQETQGQALVALRREHKKNIADLKQSLAAQKLESQEEITGLRRKLEENEQELRDYKETVAKQQVVFQDGLTATDDAMRTENDKQAKELVAFREHVDNTTLQTSQTFETAERATAALGRELEQFGRMLKNEQVAREEATTKLAERIGSMCPTGEFVAFREKTLTSDAKHELQVEELQQKLADLLPRVDEALESVAKAGKATEEISQALETHAVECDTPQLFNSLKAQLDLLEYKLSQSPVMERIMRPLPKSPALTHVRGTSVTSSPRKSERSSVVSPRKSSSTISLSPKHNRHTYIVESTTPSKVFERVLTTKT